MSTLSGVSSKGEKGKSKFQSLDINSLYHKSSKGESSEQHQTKSTVPRKHGMQSLGKVPSTRRAPVNLPSLKSEHSGSDPTVSLVPTGGTGWGSKASDAPPITSTSPVSTTSGPTPGTNAPAVVGTAPVPQTNITPTPPQPPKPVVSVGGDKTWSSVMVGGEGGSGGVSLGGGNGPSFLAHQSPQFQAEFPSLLGEGGVPGPPPQGGEGGYGPGPSLRPQTEGSWAHGGGYQAPPPTQDTQPRPLTQFPPPVSTPNIVPQYKGVVPSFMLNSRSGSGSNSSTDVSGGVGVGGGGNIGKFPGSIFPSNFPNPPPIRPSNKFHGSTEVRYSGSRPPPTADPEEMMPRPIIREEDLNRMDEISRDTGWATQDDIDYDQKLAFSDDESTGNDDEKDKVKSLSLQSKEEKKDIENGKENREKININERLTEKSNHPWQGRSTANIPAPDFRSTHSRMHHPNAREMEMDDVWREKRRQTSEQVAAVAEKAKQRKEEEEKRFEETRSKTENERKKKDTENDWDKEEKKDLSLVKEVAAETFRQMTHLESRNYPRQEPQQSYSRYPNPLLPPRFQKQQNIRQQQQSGSSENRWGNNQHFPSNKQRIRGDNDENKEKEDERDKRERNTPEPSERFRSGSIRNDRSYDNRKSSYYDNQHDYNRGYHRDNDQERDRNKETESRIRDRENEVEWDNRRMGGSTWDGNRNFEDNKPLGRRDNKKPNEGYNKPHSGLFDERDNDWRERPENRDRPVRPDSRDSRASRDSRTSREDTRSVQDPVNNDYTWADGEFEKEIHEERPRRKENYKEDRRETQPSRREGYVPGPITKEKMEAYEHKHNMAQYIKQEKKELLSSVSLESKNNEEDSWKKTDLSNNVSWADSADDNSGQQQQQQPSLAQNKGASESPFSAPAPGSADDNSNDRSSIKEEVTVDKKKDISITSNNNAISNKDKGMGTGRGTGRSSGPGGGRGGGGNWQHYSSNYVCYRGSGSWGNNKDTSSRKGISKSGKQWTPASDSEPSGDEISASTESGKEDKKIERKQAPRSPKSGERKKDKDDRIRDPKKNEPSEKSVGGNMNRKSQQQHHLQQNTSQHQSNQAPQAQVQTTNMSSQNQQQGGAYDTGGGRKEGFQPRGEPSRRGRGGFRVSGGRGPHIGSHYGPPGSKPAFPTPPPTNKEDEVAESSSEEKKRTIITGRKDQRKGDSDGSRSSKTKTGKLKREQEEWETTSEGSDSEAKGKQQRHLNKKNSQRLNNDKRGPFNSSQMNGRPSRLEEGKIDERLNKEDDDNSHLTNHTDVYHTNNGFQEVKSKKTGKDNRPLSKEELKKNRGKDNKGKGPQGGNPKGSQNKNFTREWSNKPPRMQRMAAAYLQQQQQQSHQEVSDMNKLNHQNISMFPIRTEVNCPAPAPPPPVNAWDKPITAALRTTPPPANLQHLAPSMANSQDKNVIELNDHGQSGTSSQTSSPSAEKALSKMGREAVEKSLLDGTTPPVQTIIFENTNYKVAPNDMNMKTKYPIKGQRIDKGRVERKLDEELEDGAHLGLGFKPGNEIKPGENKPQEPIQMPMSFSKSEDNADMKLDFAFDSDLTQLTDDKSNIPRSIHQGLGQNSDAELNEKIASVKKVWETPGSMMEHQHHDEVVSTSSSFTPNFGSAVDTSLDHSSVHQVDDTTFATPDVYAHQNPSTNRTNYFIIAGPQMQGSAPGYASGGANIIKQDPSNATSNVCKVKPQPQQAVISSAIGTHSGGPSLSSPPPPFTQQGHFNYQTQYSNIPAIPSPPAVLINSPAGGQQVPPSHQGELYHSFPIGGPTVIGSQQARSGFSQFPYGLGQSLGGTSAFSQQSLYHLQQAAPPNPPPDVFQSISQYRIQPSAYGQSQQLSNSPSTVLITSSSNSLMSASVKSSPQPPPIGAIGSKGAYQSSAVPSQVQLGFIPYDATQILPQSFLQNSQLVQRHGANNVVPTIQPPTSYYSGSAGGQTGLFQPGSSILTGGGSQPAALHNAATAFGMQGFGAQSTAPAQPASNNPVGVPYSSQMGHFRGQAPAAYLKAAGGNPVTGQHASDPAKSPSTNQDINSVFSTGGGGQIPSPKSRNVGNSGAGGKQSQTPQQPSPTQGHHKFTAYPAQPNLVIQGGGNNPQQQQLGGRGGVPPVPQGVRTGNNNGNGLGGNAGVARYPTPIQRPPSYPGLQPQRHRVQQSRPQPVSQQQHLQKISSQYYQQQGNAVKLDVEGKNEGDKLQEQTNPGNTKQEKKEETTNSSEQ